MSEVPVLDTKLRSKRLYADPNVISFGKHSLALDDAEWCSYWATHTATKRMLVPTSHSSEWDFMVGTYPYYGGSKIIVHFYESGRREEQPEEWVFLVNLVRQYLEPRLLTGMADRIRGGETVQIGGNVEVNQTGVSCPKPRFSVPWRSMGAPRPYNGMIWLYQNGVEKPLVAVPMSHPNAGLIPALFHAVSQGR